MPRALQGISFRVTNPSTTFTAVTANTGDSLTVKNFTNGRAWIVQAWTKEGTLGDLRVRSPLLHEATQGIRMRTPLVNKCRPLMPFKFDQPLQAQDALTVEMTGGAAETDVGTLLIYYEDLMVGGGSSLLTPQEVDGRLVQMVGLPIAVTSGGTAGQYGGSVAINSTVNILKANTAYAILGYLTDTEFGNIGITGPDFANLRVSAPGSTDAYLTANWFQALSDITGLPCVPTFNSANAGNTTIDVVDTATGTAANITLLLAQLSGAPPAPSAA
jgi:hypothetical protein